MTKTELKQLLQPIVIAQIKEIKEHPDADRLIITMVDDGSGELIQVVTGAPNVSEGDFVPYLGVGHVVPGFKLFENQEITLQKKPLRGVDSYGMILAEDEIGPSEDHEGILILNSKLENSKFKIGDSLVSIMPEVLEKVAQRAGVVEMTPELQERIDLIMSIGDPETGGEVVGEDELPAILASGEELFTYDGFEPSGQMHIAQGIIRAINTNKMIEAGFTFRMWVADWFGYLNNKMGGDLEKIKKVGTYFIEIWKASGMDVDGVEFLWTSDYMGDREYWETVMKVAKSSSLNRILKTTEIMGRSETDDLSAAQILYPCMQTTDIFYVMKAQVTQLGMDQRKVNMLARDIGEKIGYWKPVVVSHGMLQGLQKLVKELKMQNEKIQIREGELKESYILNNQFIIIPQEFGNSYIELSVKKRVQKDNYSLVSNFAINFEEKDKSIGNGLYVSIEKVEQISKKYKVVINISFEDAADRAIAMKMSKSKPDTAIFMTDTREDIERKIIAAYCPPQIIEDNPILAYCKQIIFEAHYLKRENPLLGSEGFEVKREEKFGGSVSYKTYQELEDAFAKGDLFPLDLKNAVIEYVDQLILPVRKHFEEDERAKNLLEEVRSFQVTR